MSYRTYLPTLIAIINTICKYTVAHDERIRSALAGHTAALSAYNALLVACDAFRIATLGILSVGD